MYVLGFVTKLSSAGLVYKHFGKELVAAATGQPADSPTVETTWLAVYKYFMEAVDGIDNGKHSLDSMQVVHCMYPPELCIISFAAAPFNLVFRCVSCICAHAVPTGAAVTALFLWPCGP